MKKVCITLVLAMIIFWNLDVTAYATEMILYQIKEETQMKEQPDDNAKTLVVLEPGTPVIYVAKEQDWIQVRYQEYEGYIPLIDVSENDGIKNLEEEFAEIEQNFDCIYQRTLEIQREQVQETIWKVTIIILGIAIVVLAVIMKTRKVLDKHKEEQ